MTMQFKCDCCGHVEDVPNRGAPDSASVSNDGDVPDAWRTIFTVIEVHGPDGSITMYTGHVAHSCADCNSHMLPSEHLEAEEESRLRQMRNDPDET